MRDPSVVWKNRDEIVRLSVGVFGKIGEGNTNRICYMFDEEPSRVRIRISSFQWDAMQAVPRFTLTIHEASRFLTLEQVVELVEIGKLPDKAIPIAMELLL